MLGEPFNGNAGGDMYGCMRWQDGQTGAVGWSFSSTGEGSGATCAGDEFTRGYECLCDAPPPPPHCSFTALMAMIGE